MFGKNIRGQSLAVMIMSALGNNMKCLDCGNELKKKSRIKKSFDGIAFDYFHCPICNKDYDSENYLITIKGDKYERVRDRI